VTRRRESARSAEEKPRVARGGRFFARASGFEDGDVKTGVETKETKIFRPNRPVRPSVAFT